MNTRKRRNGYIATLEGVKQLKEAKQVKKYTYKNIAQEAKVTLDKVKQLFNPQWGNGRYKIGKDAVDAICTVLNLKSEDIVTNCFVVEIFPYHSEGQELVTKDPSNTKSLNKKVLQKIKQAARDTAEELDLSGMELSEIPPEIKQLNKLKILNLYNNLLRSLPPEIGQLNNLTILNLADNSLRGLPPEIGQLKKLKILNLDNNSLRILPPEIVNLPNLTQLHLYNNLLKILPLEIVQLTTLKILDLNNNSLSSVPPEIGQLINLTQLDLHSNSLSSMPPEIGQLINLTQLDLHSNSLSSVPPEIGQLINLTQLDLHSNSLSSVPPEIGQLINLEQLDLGSTSLSNLPSAIGQLTNLKELYLNNNSLGNLPSEIAQLIQLSHLELRNNSLPIPPEILEKRDEPANILNYYLSIQNNHNKPLHEAKMLLIGQGNVGKTCLKERLMRDKYEPSRNKTDGIDIEPWNIELEGRQIQVNIWDFGGQEIMHSTHQFFLTKRSLYLLVLDTTLGEEENRIEYWLKIIQSFGKNSPVIIVGNKADQHPLDIDKRGLKSKYPQIKGFLEISCQIATGIEKLTAVIKREISQLEHIDDELPLTWFKIKNQLEILDKDYIPYHKYESLCEKEGVTKEDNQRILIQFLHDLGIVLNFCDDPRLEDTHVLNPEWITNGVYKILNDRQLILEHKGILARSMLKRILEKDRYPRSKHLFIIDMMRKFELCFDVEADNKFLIPDILPKEEPFTGEWDKTLAFEYHYPVLPSSIISRFIVRMNHYIYQKTYWRSGVVLANENNKALVKADREDKKIVIRVNGIENTRRNLLTAIRSEFDYIHKTIPGIVPEEKVPLLDYPEIPPVDYKWFLDLERKKINKIIPPGLTNEINIKKLLNGIASEASRREDKKDVELDFYHDQTKKSQKQKVSQEIFISYSWREESKKIADELDSAFQAKRIMITRDLRYVTYKDRIQAFMKNLGRGKCVIVIISQAYLESENCMFELLQIAKHGEFSDRIFPIVLPDAKIYKPKDRIKYVQYWEQETNELDEAMKTVSSSNLHGFRDDIDLYTEIRNNLPQLTNILKDINSLTAKIHSESGFTELIKAVELRLME